MKTITAKYSGRCFECGQAIKPGDRIKFYGRLHSKHEYCNSTADSPTPALQPDRFDMQAEDNMRDACGL